MVKEAVEEAKAQAAEAEEAGADQKETAEKAENPAEMKHLRPLTAHRKHRRTQPRPEKPKRAGTMRTEAQRNSLLRRRKKKLFGKKNKKDKKDEKIDELTDRLTRQMAEFDNFRKRTEKEKSQMYEIGAKDIIEKILPIVDNFERGLASMPEDEKSHSFC